MINERFSYAGPASSYLKMFQVANQNLNLVMRENKLKREIRYFSRMKEKPRNTA